MILAVLTSQWRGLTFTLPVTLPLLLSPALSVWTSRVSRISFLATPEELTPPSEVALALQEPKEKPLDEAYWIRRMLIEPPLHVAHLSGLPSSSEQDGDTQLIEKVFQQGPASLTEEEKRHLLASHHCLQEIHFSIWRASKNDLPEVWKRRNSYPTAA